MAKTKTKKKEKAKPSGKGLSPTIWKGLSKKRYTKGSATNRCKIDTGSTVTVQFIDDPSTMTEFVQHQFRDGGKWNYVPCAGDDCPLCEDDDPDVSKQNYRFLANVYNLATKQVEILEGPKTLAGRIAFRWGNKGKRSKKLFPNRTWDITKFDTQPVSYDVERGDDSPLKLDRIAAMKPYDLEADVTESLRRYYGDDMPAKGGKTAMDDDAEDEDYEEDEYEKEDLEEMERSEIRKIARAYGIKTKRNGEPVPKSKLIKAILREQG